MKATEKCLDDGRMPLVLGGDRSIAIGSVAGRRTGSRRGEHPDLIWFDAHGDANTPETTPSGNIHGMSPRSRCYGDHELVHLGGRSPKVLARNTVLIGIRDIDRTNATSSRSPGVTCYIDARPRRARHARHASDEAIRLPDRHTAGIHLSFDLDVVDPEDAPGTGTPVLGRHQLREAHLAMEMFADRANIVSMDRSRVEPRARLAQNMTGAPPNSRRARSARRSCRAPFATKNAARLLVARRSSSRGRSAPDHARRPCGRTRTRVPFASGAPGAYAAWMRRSSICSPVRDWRILLDRERLGARRAPAKAARRAPYSRAGWCSIAQQVGRHRIGCGQHDAGRADGRAVTAAFTGGAPADMHPAAWRIHEQHGGDGERESKRHGGPPGMRRRGFRAPAGAQAPRPGSLGSGGPGWPGRRAKRAPGRRRFRGLPRHRQPFPNGRLFHAHGFWRRRASRPRRGAPRYTPGAPPRDRRRRGRPSTAACSPRPGVRMRACTDRARRAGRTPRASRRFRPRA